MTNNGWIDAQERRPTEQDADFAGCVLVWHAFNGVMVTGWHQFEYNRFLTHWQPPPEPPPNYKELRAQFQQRKEVKT